MGPNIAEDNIEPLDPTDIGIFQPPWFLLCLGKFSQMFQPFTQIKETKTNEKTCTQRVESYSPVANQINSHIDKHVT